ncbi:unnamed protein product [Cylindrotheca closterium]|uniref:PCI domain-containing protein n=1 Tax=Cylindrotheca closterium TaxID=2856 RepID=A0AAD2CQV9_9STRA|nr:unnamed protein product [Cylindrotheca closterium]
MEELLLDESGALVQFLEAVEQSSPSTLRALVLKVLSHPQIFCGFDQLKAIVKVKSEDSQLLETLDLFSYGAYQDFSQNQDKYLSLNDLQLSKLRQLTVLTTVQEACKNGVSLLSYSSLGEALGIDRDNGRGIEQIIISCIYARVLNGKLCQKSQQFKIAVPPCCSRDVTPSQISDILTTLETLRDRLESSNDRLEKAQNFVRGCVERDDSHWKTIKEQAKQAQSQSPNAATGIGASNVRNALSAGWSADQGIAGRRFSASRQSKRSRGGMGSFTESNFQRF